MDKLEHLAEMRRWIEKEKAGGFKDNSERKEAARVMVRASMAALEDDYKSKDLLAFYMKNRVMTGLLPCPAGLIAHRCISLALSVMFFAEFSDIVGGDKPAPVDQGRN
jgi:hypothetical protein